MQAEASGTRGSSPAPAWPCDAGGSSQRRQPHVCRGPAHGPALLRQTMGIGAPARHTNSLLHVHDAPAFLCQPRSPSKASSAPLRALFQQGSPRLHPPTCLAPPARWLLMPDSCPSSPSAPLCRQSQSRLLGQAKPFWLLSWPRCRGCWLLAPAHGTEPAPAPCQAAMDSPHPARGPRRWERWCALPARWSPVPQGGCNETRLRSDVAGCRRDPRPRSRAPHTCRREPHPPQMPPAPGPGPHSLTLPGAPWPLLAGRGEPFLHPWLAKEARLQCSEHLSSSPGSWCPLTSWGTGVWEAQGSRHHRNRLHTGLGHLQEERRRSGVQGGVGGWAQQ